MGCGRSPDRATCADRTLSVAGYSLRKTGEKSRAKEPDNAGKHPIWSETHQVFVVAGQLEIGEQFRTVTGQTATLTKIHPHRGPQEMVFNLEVDGQHVYHVTSSGCWHIIFFPGGIGSHGPMDACKALTAGER